MFALAALLMVLTPGPNMIYLVSRSLCQGTRAGVISLFGVAAGFLVAHVRRRGGAHRGVHGHSAGATRSLKWLGAAYLLWLAWQAIRPGPRRRRSSPARCRRFAAQLFAMGFLTNALNPKIAVFYLSVFPQFVRPEHGSVLGQSVTLGFIQIAVSFGVNLRVDPVRGPSGRLVCAESVLAGGSALGDGLRARRPRGAPGARRKRRD